MRAIWAALLVATIAFAGCAGDDEDTMTTTGPGTTTSPPEPEDHTPQTHEVRIAGNAFVNGTITIRTGDSVSWTHADGTTAHTVTADDDSFDSNPNCFGAGGIGIPLAPACMTNGSVYERTFSEEGDVAYHCKVHPSMTGTISVIAH